MRFLSRAAVALLIGASAPAALVAPALAQTCVCPPAGAVFSGPAIQSAEPPPPLPEYEQPQAPVAGYSWTPGYWAWNNNDYYWVPGVWVQPPRAGLLWTPPYWAFVGGVYVFRAGYWAERVGFYGGINYGFGYVGNGYEGGRWDHGQFYYNRAVNNLNPISVARVYNQPITITPATINRVSYNGGQGGLQVKPTPEQEQVVAQPHFPPTQAQITHVRTASVDADQFEFTNKGKPPVAAAVHPAELKGPGVVPAKSVAAAEANPASGQNGPTERKLEEKPAPGAKLPPAGQPLNAAPNAEPAKAEEKLQVEKPLGSGKPMKSEPLNGTKAKEKLPAREIPGGKKPSGAENSKGMIEKQKGAYPKAEERLPAAAMSGGPPKPQERTQNVERAQGLAKVPLGAGERKPPRREGRRPECGKPRQPKCT